MIWKAIHNEQEIRHDIEMFKNWLSIQSIPTSYTYPDLQLINITKIVTQLIFKQPHIYTNHFFMSNNSSTNPYTPALFDQTLAKAEAMAQSFAEKAIEAKGRLWGTRFHHKNTPLFDKIYTLIITREQNMVESAQYNTNQQLLRLFL
jgi:hypothetical protein